ncbi:MAG: four helix bundle protein [Flavobacteriaceae bacterium]|nr:four helix bundle protein [Flavobacteriaceae bacterium]
MKIQKFEDIIAWQKAQDLAVVIYNTFSKSKDFGFKDQIQRASVSISNNIAEGFDRMSDKEFVRFLYIAQASCSEVKSMLYLSNRLNYLDTKTTKQFVENANEIGRIIRGLIKSLSKKS